MTVGKKANKYMLVRHPKLRYAFSFSTTPNYMYCSVSPRDLDGRLNKRGSTLYHINNIPVWVKEGMDLIDLALQPDTKAAHIPGFGGKVKDKYFFYWEGVVDEPHNLS